MNFLVGYEHLAATQINPHLAEGEGRVGVRSVRSGCMAQGRSDSSEQFIDAKGFGHIIVSAEIERGHFLLFLLSRRQHDDRRCGPVADLADDLGAIHVRQSEIKENEIGIPGLGFDQSFPTRRGLVNAKAMTRECCPEKTTNFRFILDQNDRRFL
jgi:hypothetical protein